MSLFVASLNSGSNGNCYYVGNSKEAVLIDAGISCREIESRMAKLKLDMKLVKAIFISHEHTDHIRGIDTLSKKYKLPVYITNATLKNCPFFINRITALSFDHRQAIAIGDLTITPFSKKHDAVDPYSFVVEGAGVKVGVITDIGIACSHVVHYFKQCNAAFLEANYDEQMLEEGSYPLHLKKRIKGGKGHLSNRQALELFTVHKPSHMSHLFLAHLSKENNNPRLVQELFKEKAGKTTIVVTSRYNESEVYEIKSSESGFSAVAHSAARVKAIQMSLFENLTT